MEELRIKVASLNVSCDTHAQKVKVKYGEEYDFKKRFEVQLEEIEKHEPDVVILQEIRYLDNLHFVKEKTEKKYNVYTFWNNKDEMSFHNCICVRKGSQWEDIGKKHYWTTIDKNTREPFLSEDETARVEKNEKENISGNPFGRCVGVVVLKNTSKDVSKESDKPSADLVVASAHVVPYDRTKEVQQKATLSLASMVKDITGKDCPVIIAGDFNIFNEDREGDAYKLISTYAESLSLKEIPLARMVIPGESDIPPVTDSEEIGTFNPWSTDTNAELVYKQPLGYSKLDAIFGSTSLKYKDGVTVYPILLKPGGGLNNPSDNKEKGKYTELRYKFKDRLASDHFLLTAEFTLTK